MPDSGQNEGSFETQKSEIWAENGMVWAAECAKKLREAAFSAQLIAG